MKLFNTCIALMVLALSATQLSCTVNQYCIGCDLDDAGGSGTEDVMVDGDGSGSNDAMVDAGCIPSGAEICDGDDNDCDGLVDNGVLPQVGDVCPNVMGACAGGILACTNGQIKCDKLPTPEQCDGIDNNCNGTPDEGNPGGGGKCGTDQGECVAGTRVCGAVVGCDPSATCDATALVNNCCVKCMNFIDHRTDPETCNAKDDNCNGLFDEGVGTLGTCGPANEVGECQFGTLTCQGGAGVCTNAVFPAFEICNGKDDNCDGFTDEIFDLDTDPRNCGMCATVCATASKTCINSTVLATNGTNCTTSSTCAGGTCAFNSQPVCAPVAGMGTCGYQCNPGFIDRDLAAGNGCEYRCFATGPEVCDGIDNDCDGTIDNGVTPPAICLAGGECGTVAPVAQCNGALGWRCTYPGNTQFPETRCDGLNNDCDANIDENQPNLTQACDDGRTGVCRGTGTFQCNTASETLRNGPSICVVTVPGQATADLNETCDDKDNDCDGKTDEGSEMGNLIGQDWITIGGGRQVMKYEASRQDSSGTQQGTKSGVNTAQIAVNGATQTGAVATFTTTAPHGLTVGMKVRVSGVGVSGYNGLWTIATVPTTTTFTATLPTTGLAPSGNGTVVKFIGACSKAGALPWTNVTYPEALAVCESMSASLCSETRWHQACSVVAPRTFPVAVDGGTTATSGTRIEAEDFFRNVAQGGPETQCGGTVDDDGDGRANDGCPAVASGGGPETGAQCTDSVDSDGDGRVNDGCPITEEGAETGAQCTNNTDDDGDGRINDGCPAEQEDGETGTQCNNNTDDDGDGRINDGCPATEQGTGPETGNQCNNNTDDDNDGRDNDGCPQVGTRSETGAECNNNADDDGDGRDNDGCPAVARGVGPEAGTQCSNNTDDDNDGRINDGCPIVTSGIGPETGSQCNNNIDDDADGRINDGCPVVIQGAGPETACADALDDDADGFVNDGCPEFIGGGESGTQCANNVDDDGDTFANDGCPALGPQSWQEDYTPANANLTFPQQHFGIANMRALPNSGGAYSLANALANSPYLEYQLMIPANATYRVWVRMYSPTGADDTLHIGVSTSATAVAPTQTVVTAVNGSWVWQTADFTLTTGTNYLRLFMGDDGLKVDTIFIGRTATPVAPCPNGSTTATASCATSDGGTWSYATTPDTYQPTTCNGADRTAANDDILATGSLASCFADHDGAGTVAHVFDMSGNVKEWTLARLPGQNPIRGGSSNDTALGTSCGLNFILGTDTFFFPNVGFRCCR